MADNNKPLVYLKNQLNDKGDFLDEWKRLEDSDKATLKEWAVKEIAATT